MIKSIYVASWFENAPYVRTVHGRIRGLGLWPTSSWAHEARGPDDFARFTPEELRAIAEQNDRDLQSSNGMICIVAPGKGGETFCELTRALFMQIPVFYVGTRRILSCYRPGIVLCDDVDDALVRIMKHGRAA